MAIRGSRHAWQNGRFADTLAESFSRPADALLRITFLEDEASLCRLSSVDKRLGTQRVDVLSTLPTSLAECALPRPSRRLSAVVSQGWLSSGHAVRNRRLWRVSSTNWPMGLQASVLAVTLANLITHARCARQAVFGLRPALFCGLRHDGHS